MTLKMLAFNTSTAICSVALLVDDVIDECCGLVSYQHEKNILSMIDYMLLKAHLTLQALDCLVFCRGPGSFVGVRIGVSVAQGLSLGANLPLVEVSSLEVLARGVWRLTKSAQVLSIIGAGLGEVYWGCYYREGNGCWLGRDTELIIDLVDIPILISKLCGQWVLVGQDWDRYSVFLSKNITQISTRKIAFPLAQDMLSIAKENWAQGDILSVDQIGPIYFQSNNFKYNKKGKVQ